MKKNNTNLADDEIDLGAIIKLWWMEKILILSNSLIFMVAGYIYSTLKTKIYKTEVTLRHAPSYLFKSYRHLRITQTKLNKEIDLAKQFNDQVKLNLLSLDTLVQFVKKNNKIIDFKNHLKEKKLAKII